MESVRKPFQGVTNIFRFNWHFFVLAGSFVVFLFVMKRLFPLAGFYLDVVILLVVVSTLLSLLVSYLVYDLSDLYKLRWLDNVKVSENSNIVTINAGFDETSELFCQRYGDSKIFALDFYDPLIHTEVSIKRARKAYPTFPGTQKVTTSSLPLEDDSVDLIFAILAAHEIRDSAERELFFKEMNRILKSNGKIVVTEHLRDLPNFLAYNIGFFHFHSKSGWKKTFLNAGFLINREIKITPFISTFILEKNGITP